MLMSTNPHKKFNVNLMYCSYISISYTMCEGFPISRVKPGGESSYRSII